MEHVRSDVLPSLATTTAEVEALRRLWESLAPRNIDADIDYFLAVVANHPAAIGPFVLRVEREGGGSMLVVARLEHHRFPIKLGYRTIAQPHLRTIVVSFDGMLGAASDDDVARCARALQSAVHRGDADAIIFQKLDQESSTRRLIKLNTDGLRTMRSAELSTKWLVDLPDTMDEFLGRRSSSSRRRIRTDIRKLERDYPGAEVRHLEQLDTRAMLDELERVSSKGYQRALGVGGTNTELGRSLIAASKERGWLRVWMLYLDGTPVAFWLGTLYSGVFTIDSPSFDPAYTSDSVGMYTMFAMVAELCSEPLARELDFGHGDAEYKKRYATRTVTVKDEVLLARRLRPATVGAVLNLAARAKGVAFGMLGEQRVERLRKAWRSTLVDKRGD